MKRRILALFLIIILLFNVGAMTSCSLLLTQTPGANGADGKDGVDGKDGADGKDGITPMLRINVETNYWEVSYDNGESWSSLGVKATGENGSDGADGKDGESGADGKDGTDGKDGADGKDGVDGKDGITPKLRINPETHEWEVSYDNGESWSSLGYKADISEDNGFDGLKISILGDSISTYVNVSSGNASAITNSTIKGGAVYYNAGTLGVYQGDTWWQQTADYLGGSILVNNSWSGSCVFSTRAGTVGAYVDRCVQLHDDTGMNAGEEPDIIFVYLGTNDCSVSSTYPLGTYESIDFSSLIKKSEAGYSYEEPKTASEAYAIMLHKISQRYDDAEIYCLIPCQRKGESAEIKAERQIFYESIEKCATRFGAFTVDLYNDSGITVDADSFGTYIADNSLHPGPEGMDAITNTVLSVLYLNSGYTPKERDVFSISYETDAMILEGRRYAALEGEPFTCSVKEKDGYELNISVFMDGEDISTFACKDNLILVEKVTGNLVIKAEYNRIVRDPLNFRFETVDDELLSVTSGENTENSITQNQGTIADGLYTSAQFSLGTSIELIHNRPWVIEWRMKGTPNTLLLSSENQSSLNKGGEYYLYISNGGFVALGEYTGSQFDNYVSEFSTSYYNEMALYRLCNRVFEDGSNMVYLYINGDEIGPLNDYRINGGAQQNVTEDWACGKDFIFSNIGTITSHSINGCYLDYIQIYENGCGDIEKDDNNTPYDDGEINVLTIGSSYQMDASVYIYDILSEFNIGKVKVGNLYIGGSEIDQHLSNLSNGNAAYTYYEYENGQKTETLNYSMADALDEMKWDFIVINQGAHNSGIPSSYSNLGSYLELIKDHCPDARIGFMMNWTYSEKSTLANFKSDFDGSEDVQYEGIITSVKECVLPLGFDYIIPCGTAFRNARTSKLSEYDLTRDPVSYGHGSVLGCYMLCLTMVATLTDLDVESVEFTPEGVTEEQKAIVMECCLNAILNPYETTVSEYQ